jgi:RNA-binding protein YlmH
MPFEDQTKADALLRAQIENVIRSGLYGNSPKYTAFLDERQQVIAEELLRRERVCSACFFGGTDGCERRILGVFPEEIPVREELFPIVPLQVSHSSRVSLTHRDYLGSLMALQVKREMLGDFLIEADHAIIFAHRNIAEFLRMNLVQIGRNPVSVEEYCGGGLQKTQEYDEIFGTVPSFRLDCIVALLMRKGRSAAAKAITAGLVRVNAMETDNHSKLLNAGDTISIRGMGKFIMTDEVKTTKKDRYLITIHKLR